jgi:DNA processing protein
MEQNREVFAIPGNITSPASYGPNFLIKEGAKLVQSFRDVIDELPGAIREEIISREEDIEKDATREPQGISAEERRILMFLKLDEATHFDKLYQSLELEIAELSERLLNLELEGWIRKLPGNLYIRIEAVGKEWKNRF